MRNEELLPITEDGVSGMEEFDPSDFNPCKGTILVVLPPKIAEKQGIVIPDNQQERPNYGRVAAVPTFRTKVPHSRPFVGKEGEEVEEECHRLGYDPVCPVFPGQWVVFRPHSESQVPFLQREDLVLLTYADDCSSHLLGFFDQPPVGKDGAGSEGTQMLAGSLSPLPEGTFQGVDLAQEPGPEDRMKAPEESTISKEEYDEQQQKEMDSRKSCREKKDLEAAKLTKETHRTLRENEQELTAR